MPKVPTKKTVKKVETKEQLATTQPIQEVQAKSPPVFRLFECVVHLEIALAELKKVGIFPGPEEQAVNTKLNVGSVTLLVEQIYKQYLTAWGAMPK